VSGRGRHGGALRPAALRRTAATADAGTRARRPLLTWADRVVLYTLVGLGVLLLILPAGSGEARLVRIEGAAGFETTVRLDRDAEIDVPGPLGTTIVRVEAGAVRVASSPCRQQICVGMGAARKAGAVIVCVPNEVVVRVLGDTDEVHDALTR
jgi:hypothetical protein